MLAQRRESAGAIGLPGRVGIDERRKLEWAEDVRARIRIFTAFRFFCLLCERKRGESKECSAHSEDESEHTFR